MNPLTYVLCYLMKYTICIVLYGTFFVKLQVMA